MYVEHSKRLQAVASVTDMDLQVHQDTEWPSWR
jgi:hypothetical protein